MGRTLTYQGGNESHSYTVRDRINVLYLTIDAPSGGDGGDDGFDTGGSGGPGGRIIVALDVSSGEVIDIYTGAGGNDGQDEGDTGDVAQGGTGGPSPLTNGQDGSGAFESGEGGGGGGGGGESGADAPNGDAVRAGGGGGGSGANTPNGGGGDGGGPGGAGGPGGQSLDGADGSPGSTTAEGDWSVQSQTDGGSTHSSAGWVQLVEGGPDSCSTSIESKTNTSITLALSSSSDTDGYYIYRSRSQGFTPTTDNRIADISRSGSSQTYEDTGRTEGTRYYYAVEAYNADGVTEDRVDPLTVAPAPTALEATNALSGTTGKLDSDEIGLAWTLQSTDETGVRVLLSADGGSTWTNVSGDSSPGSTTLDNDLGPGAESFTTPEQADGEQFVVGIEVIFNDTTART